MSFNQEIRDFIAAFDAGKKLFDTTDRDYKRARIKYLEMQTDPEMLKLKKDAMRALIDQRNRAGVGLESIRRKRGELLDLQIQGARKALEDVPSGPRQDLIEGAVGAAGKRSALPVNPMDAVASLEDEERTAFARRGGVIPTKSYASGGVVEDDLDPDPDDQTAVRTRSAIDTDTVDDAETAVDMEDDGPGYSIEAAFDATRDGLNYGVRAFGLGPQTTGIPDEVTAQRRRQGARAYATGQGAYTPEEIAEIKKRIDPKGTMSEAQRNMAALGGIYQFYMNRGEFEKAQRAAFGVLQHYRLASQRYAAIAAAAAQDGDTDEAVIAALRAYDNIPDGRGLKVKKNEDGTLAYEVIDEQTGQTLTKGIATPQQLAAQAMRVAANGFDEFILEAAGQRSSRASGASSTRQSAGGASVGLKPADRDDEVKAVDEAFGSFFQSMAPEGGKPPEVPPEDEYELKINAFHILVDPRNRKRNRTPDEVVRAVARVALPNPAAPQDPGFSVKPVGKEGADGFELKFDNGPTLFVPKEQFDRLAVMRGRLLKEVNPAKTGPAKAGFMDELRSAIQRGSERSRPVRGGYSSPLSELHQSGRVSSTRVLDLSSTGPTSDLERINAARRALGQRPVTQEELDRARQALGQRPVTQEELDRAR